MSGAETDVLELTKSGLETGLRVRHIAVFDLRCCNFDADPRESLGTDEFVGFDCVPVRRDGLIVGYFDLLDGKSAGLTSDRVHLLDDSVLVSADEPLTTFIPQLKEARYKLVIRGHGIEGIVTRSDLQKLPVRLFAFSLVTHLEMVMTALIRQLFTSDEQWLTLLSDNRRGKVNDKWNSLRRDRVDPPKVEAADFCDKRVILKKQLTLGHKFEQDLIDVENLRNDTAHAATYDVTESGVQSFIGRLETAEAWIRELRQKLEVGD